MKQIIAVFIITIVCAVVIRPLYGSGFGESDPLYDNGRNLLARFFVDPNYDALKLQQTDANQKNGQKDASPAPVGESGKSRTVFNLNLTVGASLVYNRVRRVVSPNGTENATTITVYYFSQNIETRKSLGLAPVVNINFIFNVAKYFGLGFGGDAGYLVMNARRMSLSYSTPLTETSRAQVMALYKIYSPDPSHYLEVPVYGLMRFYFGESFQAMNLSLGGGYDFFLLGHPAARSPIIRGGIGFTLDNGFMMDFSYQYNFELLQKSRLTNLKEMHRGTVTLGYCFNVGK
jgi:hypothetical protein